MSSILVVITAGAAAVLEGYQAPGSAELVRAIASVAQHFTQREKTTQQQVETALRDRLRGWDLHTSQQQLVLGTALSTLKDYQWRAADEFAQQGFSLEHLQTHLRDFAVNSQHYKALQSQDADGKGHLASNLLSLLDTGLEVVARSPEWMAEQNRAAQAYMAAQFSGQTERLERLLNELQRQTQNLRFLTLPTPQSTTKLSNRNMPGRLLVAGNAIVPFSGLRRQAFKAKLLEWAQQTEHADHSEGIRLLTGPGGTGKTRLMLEVCKELRASGGNAGFLQPVTAETLEHLFPLPNTAPTLIVVDYAEQKDPLVLKTLIQAAQQRQDQGQATNLVLLARTASRAPGSWLDTLQISLGDGITSIKPEEIPPPEEDDRRAIYENAVLAFQPYTDPEQQHPRFAPPNLTRDTFKPVLFVLIAALAAAQGHDPAELSDTEALLKYAVGREQDHLYRRLDGNTHTNQSQKIKEVARALIAAAALGYHFDSREAVEKTCADLLPGFSGEATTQLAALLCDLYPQQNSKGLTKLQPDLLAEHWIETLHAEEWQQVLNFIPSDPEKIDFKEATTVLLAIAERTSRNERLNSFAERFAFEMASSGDGLRLATSAKSTVLARIFEEYLPGHPASQVLLHLLLITF